MYLLTISFALIFSAHLFFMSGYAIRWLMLISYPQPLPSRLTPNAVEAICGYAFTALLCFLSLVAFGSMVYGGLIACIFSAIAIGKLVCYHRQDLNYKISITPVFLIKVAYTTVILIIYLPSLIGLSTVYHLPDIFDLPKQIAAIISAAHAEGWPAPNPYFPDLSFAYNLLFYLPLGLIVRCLGKAKFFLPIFSCTVLWITWQTLTMLEMVMEKFHFSGLQQLGGLLLATFVSNLQPLIIGNQIPLGVALAVDGLSDFWIDNPLITTIYIPQYLFCSLCLFSAWFIFNGAGSWCRTILYTLVLSCGALAGFIFAPIITVILISFLVWDLFSTKFRHYQPPMVAMLLFLGLVGYFLWQAKNWYGQSVELIGWPIHFGWSYWISIEATLLFGCLLFLLSLKDKIWTRLGLSYSLFFLAGFLLLVFAHDVDLTIKSAFFLRLVLLIPATAGYAWLWQKLKNLILLRRLLFILPIFYLSYLSVPLITSYLALSYIPYLPDESKSLKKMQGLAFNARLRYFEPDVIRAAVVGHLAILDFRPYRLDAYLPTNERQQAINYFEIPRTPP